MKLVIETTAKRCDELKLELDRHSIRSHVLQYRLEDRTSRSMRKTLIFKGIPRLEEEKSWSDTKQALTQVHRWHNWHYSSPCWRDAWTSASRTIKAKWRPADISCNKGLERFWKDKEWFFRGMVKNIQFWCFCRTDGRTRYQLATLPSSKRKKETNWTGSYRQRISKISFPAIC